MGVDLWSLGCILAEMLLGRPLFPGSSTLDQIDKIMAIIAPPTKEGMKLFSSNQSVVDRKEEFLNRDVFYTRVM